MYIPCGLYELSYDLFLYFMEFDQWLTEYHRDIGHVSVVAVLTACSPSFFFKLEPAAAIAASAEYHHDARACSTQAPVTN